MRDQDEPPLSAIVCMDPDFTKYVIREAYLIE